ncbi:DUF6517 family protein [Halopelagius longus]|uniref:Uncharacterized protein n=1 Tax=Halopelagius longus TaxID=1236180 RepID=A0A1H1ABT8_9EURY|nr:DUF6517 family protein [Halopelagius longus]RDI70322.1 hypothetical protein DWB78_00495 [Halopelagius longus]SDQ37195.1 hypothetical protein SAMN05216278_1264 [Halopelagius longus]
MKISRTVAVLLAVAVLVSTSGCVGVLTGQEPLTVSADPAAVEESVASNAGYASNGTRTVEVNRTFSVAGQERTVVAENKMTTYEKSLDLVVVEAKLGVFTVVSTPAVEVAGKTLNPIGDYSNARLVELVQNRYSGLSDVRKVSSRTITVQGTETEVTKFAGKANVQGRQVDVYVHVTKYRDGDDFVVAIGIYPQQLNGEQQNVISMMRAIQHPA